MRSRFLLNGTEHALWLSRGRGSYRLQHGMDERGPTAALDDQATAPGQILYLDGSPHPVTVAQDGDDIHVHLAGRSYLLRYLDPVRSLAGDAVGQADDEARAPMPGTVVTLPVSVGDAVNAGDALVIIESMKLEATIRASRAGTVGAVHVSEGQSFDRDAVLVALVSNV